MLTPSFTIFADPARDLLTVTLGGFFGLDEVQRLSQLRVAELGRLHSAPNQHVTLVDVSDCRLQSQDVVAAFQRVMGDPRYVSRRLAFVTGSSLARMQVRRITHAGTRVFDTRAEAEAWLTEDEGLRLSEAG